jgi:hypothetical protein
VNVTPLGDWRTQTEDPLALFQGDVDVRQKADEGDRQELTLFHFSAQLEPFSRE